MNRNFAIYVLLGLLMTSLVAACNKKDDETIEKYDYDATKKVGLTEFSLGKNDSVMKGLDSVYFTIDMDNRVVYNADSLPVGTDVTHLVVRMAYDACKSAKFHVKGGLVQKDSVFDYNEKDSVDFTGRVSFVIESIDGTQTAAYEIKVNVHKQDPDSIYWSKLNKRHLPGTEMLNDLAGSRMTYGGARYYCLAGDTDGNYVVSNSEKIANTDWETLMVNVPSGVEALDFTSFVAQGNTLYVCSADNGELFKSADKGRNWTSCGVKWMSVIGSYDTKVLGILYDELQDKYYYDEYPRFSPLTYMDAQFPVKGASQFVLYSSKWTTTPHGVILGGETISGELVGSVWGYDGQDWTVLSENALHPAMDKTLVRYVHVSRNTKSQRLTERVAWLTFGGFDGVDITSDVYLSFDNSMNWNKAQVGMQLPEYLKERSGAQAFVEDITITESRATAPITEWECPYIFLCGGNDAHGNALNEMWVGVLGRKSQKPLQ